jgi:hypothetical protein
MHRLLKVQGQVCSEVLFSCTYFTSKFCHISRRSLGGQFFGRSPIQGIIMNHQDIHQWLDQNGVPQSTIAALSGAYDCEVSRHVRGLKIPRHRAESIDRVIAELRDLIAVSPARPDMRCVANVQRAIAAMKENLVVVLREQREAQA